MYLISIINYKKVDQLLCKSENIWILHVYVYEISIDLIRTHNYNC